MSQLNRPVPFEPSKHSTSDNMFILGGPDGETLLTGYLTESWTMQKCEEVSWACM